MGQHQNLSCGFGFCPAAPAGQNFGCMFANSFAIWMVFANLHSQTTDGEIAVSNIRSTEQTIMILGQSILNSVVPI
jgi:hypothetical protein